MTEATPRAHRQLKLRSSCDGCGSAKLKCDRGQPECGRCLSFGLPCVYGVSRKMGKRPRHPLRSPGVSSVSHKPGEHVGNIDKNRPDDNSCSSGTSSCVGDGSVLTSGPIPSVSNVSLGWDTVDGYPNNLMMGLGTLDALHSDILGPSFPDITSLEFGDDFLSTNLETAALSSLESPELEDYSNFLDNALLPPADSKSHDCSREAYDILGSLSSLDSDKSQAIPRSAPSSASTTASNTRPIPLDQILRLNREASERLGLLLTCPCAKNPHLALLYASIISRVLIWYKQATGTQGVLWSPADMTAGTVLRNGSPSGSMSGFPSPWSSTTGSTVNTSDPCTPMLSQSASLAVAPAQMAVGTFNIDDQQVETALKMQLLLGEIRRTGRLIDLFTSQSSSGVDEFTFSGVDSLYKSLSLWLRKEQSRIAESMRSRLEEVST